MLYLKRLSLEDGKDIYQMLQEIAQEENGFHNPVCGASYEMFLSWLQRQYAYDQGNLEDWMVPQSSYWFYDGELPIGVGRIRHCLNDTLRSNGGQIGYAIRASKRGKGYGTRIFSLLLQECWQLGLSEVQVSAWKSNLPSNRIIQRHGGVLMRQENEKCFYQLTTEKGVQKF